MPAEILTKEERRAARTPPPTAVSPEEQELRKAAERHIARVRRLKTNVAAWVLGTILLTSLWAVNQWQANGALERFGHDGDAGEWNPTLWALGVGIWGLIVGIMALRVRFERPATAAETDREVERLRMTAKVALTGVELRRFARVRLEGVRRLKFHAAAWVLGMIVSTPLWALIEWQDNGGFERWSDNSRPGDWEPWILYVGGVWALVIALIALRVYLARPATEAEIEREIERLRSRG